MKTLTRLSNIERAKLLFDLFAGEMPGFIAFGRALTQSIMDDPGKLKEKAIDQIETTEMWMELVKHAHGVFVQYGDKLAKNSTLFSTQLFDGYNSMYGGYCLHKYIQSEACTNRKLRNAIMLLFF